MNRELFLRLREKKRIYRLWKEGQATQNEYKEVVRMLEVKSERQKPSLNLTWPLG